MEAARLGRHPQLAIRHVAVDDDTATGTAIDGEHAIVFRPIEIAVIDCVDRGTDGGENTIGKGEECAFVEHRGFIATC